MKFPLQSLALLALLACLSMSSCKDDAWDLDNIDKTFGFSNPITLPYCSTDSIILRNFMELKEDGVVQLIADPNNPGDSVFAVLKEGHPSIKPIHIDPIVISNIHVGQFNEEIALDGTNGARGTKSLEQDQTFLYTFTEDLVHQDITPSTTSNISEDVVSIENVKFGTTTATLELTVRNFESFPNITKVHVDNLLITLPKELHISSCKVDGNAIPAERIKPGMMQVTLPMASKSDNTFTKGADGLFRIKLECSLTGADNGENFYFDAKKHKATLSGRFAFSGTFRIEGSEMNTSLIPSTGNVPLTVRFMGETGINDIQVTNVTGDLQHNIDNIDPVSLEDLPDFLNDPDVCLDIKNPMLLLEISNEMNSTIQTSVAFNNSRIVSPIKTGQLNIRANNTTRFLISRTEDESYLTAEQVADRDFVQTDEDLRYLINSRPKPDRIFITVTTAQLHAVDLDITKDYAFDLHYSFFAPLILGDKFKLVYRGTEDELGLKDDLDDLDASNTEIYVEALGINPLDFNTHLSIVLLNKEGKELSNIVDIQEVVLTKNATTPVKITVKAKPGHTLNEVLHSGANQMDGITYKAVLDAPAESQEALSSKAHVKLTDIQVTVSGGIIYDAN